MKKPRRAVDEVLRQHLGTEVNDDSGLETIFEMCVDSSPLMAARASEDDRQAAKDFLQAVGLLDSAIQRLPRTIRLYVGHTVGSMLGLTKGRSASGEEINRALALVSVALKHSTLDASMLARTEPLGKANWRAIAAVQLCRSLWRDAKGEEPPYAAQDPQDAAPPAPFALFVADMFEALGVNSRVDTALRAWRDRFEFIEPNGPRLMNR